MHDFVSGILESEPYNYVCNLTSGDEAKWPDDTQVSQSKLMFPVQQVDYSSAEKPRNVVFQEYIESKGYSIDFNTGLAKLEKDADGRITGVIAQSTADDHFIRINAAKGVLLACGGYAGNPYMMEQLDPLGTSVTTACSYTPADKGYGIRAVLTGDDKPETITVDFDEQPAALGISNYPRIQLGAMRYTTDTSLIDRASELLKGKTFKRWYGYASYRAKANDMVGGYRSSIELDTTNGAKLCDVSYDPGYEGNEGPSIYIMDGDVAYVMEGDQTELNDFMGKCIQDAYKQTCLPDPQTARDSGSARTWLFEDEMPWNAESGSTGSAKE